MRTGGVGPAGEIPPIDDPALRDTAALVGERLKDFVDLLLTDIVMPGASGTELYQRLEASRPGLRVLYTSGYTSGDLGHRGGVDPASPFLQKPFTPSSLVQKVREVLD